MGQKTHPRGLRLGIIETWDSKWYGEKEYANWLHEDLKIQSYIKEQLFRAGISKVEIERYPDKCVVHIYTARPGIVIGRRGTEVEKLTADLERLIGKSVRIVIEEIKRPELDAQLVAEGIALQLERRAAHKVAMKKAVAAAVRMGAEGIKILCGGRLGGIEMARKEKELAGRVPLGTLRANIDYGFAEANTTYGKIGVKAWIFKGEIIGKPEIKEEKPTVGFSTLETGQRIDLSSRARETQESAVEPPRREKRRERRPSGEQPVRDRRPRQRTDRAERRPTDGRRETGRRERRPTGGRPAPTRSGENRPRRNPPQE
ncbi:30S ribosomal protein S3 [Candidatus Poribacteria bacterium]|nr:30S ribosomal protein S3 [Candidatus Poribacteria bacterium]